MKHTLKKLACLAMAVVCAFGVTGLFGCGAGKNNGGDEGGKIDSKKTQLFVGIIENGYGTSWLEKAISGFEKLYENEELEEGKKGLQIVLDPLTDYGTSMQAKLGTTRSEIIFNGLMDYNGYVINGDMVDLTDIVTGSLSAFGEEGSIEDKMNESAQSTFKLNGKYYALPYTFSNFGITYNIDMFEDNALYFAANNPAEGDYSAKKLSNGYQFLNQANQVKSAGPDGVHGTSDDGLPATYEQFFALCDYIPVANPDLVPLIWAGQDNMQSYINSFLDALWSNAEGKDQMELNYTMKGTATDLISVNESTGEVTMLEPTEITEATGYNLFKQNGRYRALQFVEQMVKNENYYYQNTLSHIGAQDYFIRSGTDFSAVTAKYKKVTMFIEGMYWENEARASFETMARKDAKFARTERNFGWMPLPKVSEEQIGNPDVIVPGTSALMFLNNHKFKGSEAFKLPIAKAFVQFLHTRDNLAAFTVETSLYKPYFDYELNATELDEISPLGKSIYEYCKNAEMVDVTPCKTVLSNTLAFEDQWNTTVVDGYPSVVLKRPALNSAKYFNGIYNYYYGRWGTYYRA